VKVDLSRMVQLTERPRELIAAGALVRRPVRALVLVPSA
jgi:hypothetical protein